MNAFEVARFARQVGFGLAPDEATPMDPVGWAQSQLDTPPTVGFFTDRTGTLMQGLPDGLKLLHTQEEVAIALVQHSEAERQSFDKSKTMARPEWEKVRFDMVDYPYWRLEPWKEVLARGAMAVNGPAPVFERFWHFWTNHFTVSPATNNINTAIGPYMRMLRSRMTGSFRDMLLEAVTHPAMVLYLDNAKSTGPHSVARSKGWTKDEINENLGREMLELFSLSPAAGYTQEDVQNTAYILTGWGVERPDKWHKIGYPLGSRFDYNKHEPGTHTVMGKKYSALIHNDSKLQDLVDDLAAHPATAQRICHKLATAFIADEPPPQAVARLVQVFVRSKGHLPTLHKAVVAEVALAGAAAKKFQDPETWLWTVYRVSGTALPVVPPTREAKGERLHDILWELGQPIHQCPQPNGWSLLSRDWISREMLDRRVRYAYQFAPRIAEPGEALRRVVARQHGPDSTVAKALETAARDGSGQTPRSLWTAYLTSPDMLWS
jgi:uncharacterized protein (DUF1800 family)